MVPTTLVASILVIIPAMGALLYVLKRYEGYFEHPRVFFALGAGLVGGTFIRYLQKWLFPFDDARMAAAIGALPALLYTVVGFSFLLGLFFAAILGLRRFRLRKDTPFYGPALGAAFGAMYMMADLAVGVGRVLPTDAGAGGKVVGLLVQLAFVSGMMLCCAGAATWAGRGSAQGSLWRGMFLAVVVMMPAHAGLWYWVQIRHDPYVLLSAAMLAYGAGMLFWAQRKVLEPIVPPEIRDQIRKARRRAARRGE